MQKFETGLKFQIWLKFEILDHRRPARPKICPKLRNLTMCWKFDSNLTFSPPGRVLRDTKCSSCCLHTIHQLLTHTLAFIIKLHWNNNLKNWDSLPFAAKMSMLFEFANTFYLVMPTFSWLTPSWDVTPSWDDHYTCECVYETMGNLDSALGKQPHYDLYRCISVINAPCQWCHQSNFHIVLIDHSLKLYINGHNICSVFPNSWCLSCYRT